jgi:hypothetical protein
MKPTRQIRPSVQEVPFGQRRLEFLHATEEALFDRGIPNQHVLAFDQNTHIILFAPASAPPFGPLPPQVLV